VGSSLLKQLIELSEDNGIWTLQSGIFPENLSSLHLHLKHGFREVGRRERIGEMDGVWRDVVLMERRSEKTGT
jgi:L-amino acid N-acyltransferase YncA